MRSIHRILVPVKDPAGKPSAALRKAALIGAAFGARIELFHSLDVPMCVDPYSLPESVASLARTSREHALQGLKRLAATVTHDGGSPFIVHVESDYPVYEAIVRRAVRSKADLVVADLHPGRHSVAGFLRLNDWELLRLCPTPVLLVRSARPYKAPTVLAAVDPTHSFSKSSKLDAEILGLAASISEQLHGKLNVIHAYNPVPVGVPPSEYLKPDFVAQTSRKARERAAKGLERVLRTVKVPRGRQHLVAEHATDAIPRIARQTHSAIVALGAVSRSGIKRLFIGNTAERLLDRLSCDLLVVKPPRFMSGIDRKNRGMRLQSVDSLTSLR